VKLISAGSGNSNNKTSNGYWRKHAYIKG
jgi:hypothetical protein